MTPATIFLTALAIILARIAWTSYHQPLRRLQRAARRAQRALKAVRDE